MRPHARASPCPACVDTACNRGWATPRPYGGWGTPQAYVHAWGIPVTRHDVRDTSPLSVTCDTPSSHLIIITHIAHLLLISSDF